MRPRTKLRAAAARAARRLAGGEALALDHPPSRGPVPRYGHGRPEHALLASLIARHDDRYRRSIQSIARHIPELARIPARQDSPSGPFWLSEWLPGLDAAAIYAFIREREPALYLEVGSGVSTMWARRAIADGGLDTRIVSIDPSPRREIDKLCDEVIRSPLEATDLGLLDRLGAADVVFMDGSHRVFEGSDATTFFLDVLPRLPAGALCAIHDVFLPSGYMPDWSEWLFSEQYLLAAWLLGGGHGVVPELAAWHASALAGLDEALLPLWETAGLEGVERRGWAFWLSVPPQSQA